MQVMGCPSRYRIRCWRPGFRWVAVAAVQQKGTRDPANKVTEISSVDEKQLHT